ncbi:probable asparagine--tRNA ligase, mitochondrial isoform X1 [Saccostrea echinata]|uniref:probable asparagine--tRNA ligase, mitochondrial isoform X1 n=1 Tax=Saccostrea echinata TaxID=191078 RepID=UPI002A7F1422|nr:probable asparagine--tRNA ligase, mitochondrial isoform X1 [Saccostrea echinata]
MSAPLMTNMKLLCSNCQRFLHRFNTRRLSNGCTNNSILKGWVRHIRKQKHVTFIHVNDGTQLSTTQIVTEPRLCPSELTEGSCITATGRFQESIAKKQNIEFQAEDIKVHGFCNLQKYPFQPRTIHSNDYSRQYPHLRPKTSLFSSVMRIRNTATMAVHRYFQENGYIFIHTPILSSNDCEGAGQLFTVKISDKQTESNEKKTASEFFYSQAFLTVSGQLHLEAMASGISKVYTFSPAFRAERSATTHHLAEFYMIEAELSFTDSLEDIMQLMEGLIKFITNDTLKTSSKDIEFVHKRNSVSKDRVKAIEAMTEKDFIRMPYEEALEISNRISDTSKLKWGDDLQRAHEKALVKHCGNVPVFVTDYPEELKPFYARRNPDNRTVAGLDLLIPGVGELCGGTLREERYDLLHQKLKSKNLLDALSWYLELREFGSCPHGGFGMGFDRYLQFLLGMPNIKDVTAFPRWTGHCPL